MLFFFIKNEFMNHFIIFYNYYNDGGQADLNTKKGCISHSVRFEEINAHTHGNVTCVYDSLISQTETRLRRTCYVCMLCVLWRLISAYNCY